MKTKTAKTKATAKTIPIDEKVYIPRGGCLLRRFPGSKIKIALYLDGISHWQEVLDEDGNCRYKSGNYDECLNSCKKLLKID